MESQSNLPDLFLQIIGANCFRISSHCLSQRWAYKVKYEILVDLTHCMRLFSDAGVLAVYQVSFRMKKQETSCAHCYPIDYVVD